MSNVLSSFHTLSPEKQAILVALLRKKGINVLAELPIGRVDKTGLLPLSHAQQRLWFLSQWGDSSVYNIFETFRLRGRLDREALTRALGALVHRHEALRTTFVAVDGQPRQQIHQETAIAIDLHDVSDADDRDERAAEILESTGGRAFDLEAGPLLRVTLVKLAPDVHVLGLAVHHIVADGWSMQVLIEELAELYDAELRGRASRLAPLPIQYADWAVWQRRWLDAGEEEKQLAYWRGVLGDEHPLLELATDRPRPAVQAYRGQTESFDLDAVLVEALRERCRASGVTLFMLLLAAFQVVLHRWSGQAEIRVGVPNANRGRAEIEGLVGLFVNTHVVRSLVRGAGTFDDLLGAVREESLGAQAHQDLPFEQLVEALNPERSTSHGPLFQVMYNHQLTRRSALASRQGDLGELTIEPFGRENTVAQFDVALDTHEDGGRVTAAWTYSVDLFDAETAQRMARAWVRVLEQVATCSSVRIDALRVLDDAEADRQITLWNRDARERMARPREPWLGGVEVTIARIAAQHPNDDAVVCGASRLTFAELDERATQLAHRLRKEGVGLEVRVGIALERSVAWIVAELAVMKAGGVFVPLDVQAPEERLRQLAQDAELAVVVSDGGTDLAPHVVDVFDPTLADEPRSPLPVITHADSAAYVIYTSGSTGRPKGVVVSHGALLMHSVEAAKLYAMKKEDAVLHFAAMSFDASLEQWIGPLLYGAKVVLSGPEGWTGEKTLEVVRSERLTRVYPPTSHVMNLVERVEQTGDALTLTLAIVGGEAVPRDNVAAIHRVLGARVMNGYGPTETVITPLLWLADPGTDSPTAYAPIGRPVGQRTIYILDESLHVVPIGVTGELYIGGEGVARGYLARPDLTADRFVPDPFAGDGSRLYRTGDRVRYLRDGLVEYVGRVDTQIKLRGFRIELGEIEASLLAHRKISEAIVVVREDGARGKALVAYVTATARDEALLAELEGALKKSLPHYMVPQHFVVLDAFPRTPNGKIDRRALPAPLAASRGGMFIAPRTELETSLAAIWREVLDVERVGVHDDFFRLGGHSLLATQVVSRIKARLARDVPLRTLFEASTLESFATAIDRQTTVLRADASSPATNGALREATAEEAAGPLPLSSGQRRLWFLWHLDPSSAAYNIPVAAELRGPLDLAILRRSFDTLVARHAALRTAFPSDGSAIVSEASSIEIAVDDLHEADAARWIDDETSRPFDLERGPVFRVRLARLGQERHLLAVTMHHIVSDGWSMRVLFEELVELFDAFASGRAAELPEIHAQYTTYAIEQNAWLEGDRAKEQVAYWTAHLGGDHAVLELPSAKPRPAEQDHRGAVHKTRVDRALTSRLETIARERGVTLYVLLLAAFKVLLHRVSGQDAICVGGVTANRSALAWEPVIGFFANTHATRTRLAGGDRFVDVLARVKEASLGALAHQELPFDRVVDALRLERSLGHSPLFQVMFLHGRGAAQPTAEQTVGALTIAPLESATTSTQFDLTLATEESGGGIEAAFTYATQLWDERAIAHFARQWQRVLEAVASAPQSRIGSWRLLSKDEAAHEICRGGEHAYGESLTILERIAARAAARPGAIALTFESASLTYAELDAKSDRLARHLQALGVRKESLVGVHLERSLDLVVSLLGVMKAGGAYVPLEPDQPSSRLAEMIAEAGLGIVITHSKHRDRLPESGPAFFEIDRARHDSIEAPPSTLHELGGANLAYVIYTSGSTGKPKGAALPHDGLRNRLVWMAAEYKLDASDVFLQKTPFGFDVSVWELFLPLMLGARLIIAPPGAHRDPAELLELLVREGVTIAHFVPSMLRAFVESVDPSACTSLRQVICSGEALASDLERAWREKHPAEIHNLYGPTEASIDVTSWSCSEELRDAIPIGRAIWNTRLYVLDAELAPVAAGTTGELYVGGIGLARGYVGRADLTAERFLPDPLVFGARMYRTGDLARHAGGGVLEYLGRADHQVKIRGVRIELGEIDAALRTAPGVADGAAIVRKSQGKDARIEGYVVLAGARAGWRDDLRAHVRSTLPEAMVPARFVALAALPLTASGKLDRKALLAVDAAVESSLDHVPASAPLEARLVAIWQSVLGLERVSVRDNFFDVGGDSILSLQVVHRARECGIGISARDVFQHQTIEALARIAKPLLGSASTVEEGPLTGPAPLTPIQARFFEQEIPARHHWNQAILLEARQPLDEATLRGAVEAIVHHHDALRMRFVDGVASYGDAAPAEKLVWVCAAKDSAAVEAIATRAQASLSLDGELARVVLVRVEDGTTRLLLVIHHLVVDGVSWRILLDDLKTAYEAIMRGDRPALPPKTSSLRTWAAKLRDHGQSAAVLEQRAYWEAELRGVPDLPRDHDVDAATIASVASVTTRLDRETTRALLKEAPAAYRTQVNDLLLTALARAAHAWTAQSSVLVELEGHGREDLFEDVDTSRTVGWFTSLYPVALRYEAELRANILAIKRHLRAVPDRGIGYGLLRHLSEDAAIREALQSRARITFNYLGQLDGALDEGLFDVAREGSGPSQSLDAPLGNWLDVSAQVEGGELSVTWSFSSTIYESETVEHVARSYDASLRELIAHCTTSRGGLAIEDFPYARITQAELDTLPVDPRNVEDVYALSPMQQGMLFHRLLETDRQSEREDAYTNQVRVVVTGLDAARFVAAWANAMLRHDVLRTSFHWEGLREPVQIVHRSIVPAFETHDARGWPEEQRSELAARERARGFDLRLAPLTRVVFADVGEDSREIVWTTHHLILDGWSMAALMAEVLAQCTGSSTVVPAGPYGDFIAWLAARDREATRLYWQSELAGVSEPTKLAALVPTPRRRPTDAAEEHARHSVTVTGEAWKELQRFARRERVTVNTLVQGAWALVLARRAGKDRVVFGATVSGRPSSLAGADAMLGLFINTLPLAVEMPGGACVGDWLRGLQDKNLRLREHEEAPLYDVQRWAGFAGDALFDTLVVFENYPVDRALRDGAATLRFGEVSVTERTTFALTLTVTASELLDVTFGYPRADFDDMTVRDLAAELLGALGAIITNGTRALGGLRVLDDAAGASAIAATRGEDRAIDPTAVLARIVDQAARRPDAIAVSFEGRQLTYRDLDARTNQLARVLRARGIATGSLVGVHLERSIELVVALVGIMKAGAAYVPLEPEQPAGRLAEMIAESGLRLVIGRGALPLPDGVALADVDQLVDDATSRSSAALDPREIGLTKDDLAYVIYTSGSTGRPKGAALPHEGLRNRLEWMAAEYGFGESDVFLQKTPYGFDVSVWEFFLPLMIGARLVVAPPGAHRDPAELVSVIVREGVTAIHFVPSMLRAFVDTVTPRACASLRHVVCSGEALGADLVRAWHERHDAAIHNLYGPTEASIDVTSWTSDGPTGPSIPIGRAIWNTRLYVLDAELAPVAAGSIGELYIAGVGLARGYLARPELTAERFLPDPFASGARMYRTGDLARYDGDGVIEYLGRTDQQVKIRGVRIELGEIEAALRSHPLVADGAALLRKDSKGEARLEAFVVLEAQAPNDWRGSLGAHLEQLLPEAMVPRAFTTLERLPLTASGKLDRKALLAVESAASRDRAHVAPATNLERIAARVWEDVLSVTSIGRDDDFFALGGHSLLAVSVSARLGRELGRALSPRALFEARTLAEYARRIDGDAQPNVAHDVPLVAVPRSEALPLSYAQQRLWFLWRMAPEEIAYNISAAVRLVGSLDVDALRRAFDALTTRHEALRTTFVGGGADLRQHIHPSITIPFEQVDLTRVLIESARDDQARAWIEVEAERPFDLATGPLLRVVLVKLASDEHVLGLTVHHIVADGWSMQILQRELGELYDAERTGRAADLAPLPMQYADWAVWQRRWLEAGEQARQLVYWRDRLGDEHPVLELPTDRARPVVQTFRGAAETFEIEPDLVASLRERSRAEGVTLFMLLLAAYQIVLHRWSGMREIRVGVPNANRNRAEIEDAIGLFVNTHVLTSTVDGARSFATLLAQVREASIGAQAHQDLPFEQLVEALSAPRSTSHGPLFQVMYNHQQSGRDASFGDLVLETFGHESGVAQCDLVLDTHEDGARLFAAWTYNVDLFDAETAQRMARSWRRVLEQIAARADLRVDALAILDEAEEEKIITLWNAPALEALRNERAWRGGVEIAIADVAARYPNDDAVVCGSSRLTFAELDERATQLAHRLRAEGVRPEVRVGIALERSVAWIVAELAVMKAGGVFVPLDVHYPAERLRQIASDAALAVLVADRTIDLGSFEAREVRIDDPSLASEPTSPLPVVTHADNAAYVIYTSGSTGRPKGVVVSHGALLMHSVEAAKLYAMKKEDAVLHFAAMSFDASLEQWIGPLLYGAKVVLSDPELWTGEKTLDVVRAEGLTRVYPPTSHVMNLVERVEQTGDALTLTLAIVGGEAVPRDNVAAIHRVLGARVMNGYGPTETVITPLLWLADPGTDSPTAYAPIGRPVGNRTIYILDESLHVVPIGVTGELYIGGEGVARGYLARPDLTADRFVPDPFAGDGARLYRTGDRVRYLRDGLVEYVGRVDTQIKLRGFRIELGEIDACLLSHPEVATAAVVIRDDHGIRRLVGYVTGPADIASVKAHLSARLPEYMVPAAIVALEALPRTRHGKVDVKALPAPELATAWEAPATPLEKVIADLYRRTLGEGVARVGRHDNFFELGGSSLLVVRLIEALDRALETKTSIALAFRFQTVASLADAIAAGGDRSLIVPIGEDVAKPALYVVHPAGGHVLHYRALARELAGERRVRGIQARSLLEDEVVDEAIDAMAEDYARAIEADGTTGPLEIAGWSFGAIVAIEVARKWRARGREVRFLGLLDGITLLAAGQPLPRESIENEDDARAALERWIEASPLAPKWRRLFAMSDGEAAAWLLARFVFGDLANKPLTLAEERELLSAANCTVLLRDYVLTTLDVPVFACWASESTEREGFEALVQTLRARFPSITEHVVEATHDDVISNPHLAHAIASALNASPDDRSKE